MHETYSGSSEKKLCEIETKKSNTNSGQSKNMINSPSVLTGLSHEVRTYMNSIVAFNFLMSNNNCSETEKKEYNSHILSSCEQLLTLFDNFLDSALIDSQKPKNILTRCYLQSLLLELTIDLTRSLDRLDRRLITIVLDEETDNIEMFIDKEKVIRVIKNLFYNALENTESGYIKLGYTIKDKGVVFHVIDSGNAYSINKELLSCTDVGNYLEENKNTFTTVGIVLAQQLVQSMGGKLWIENNSLNGSAMYFTIPEMQVMDPGKSKSEAITTRIAI